MESKRVDWSRVVWDLQRLGVTPEVIARKLGVVRVTVINWRDQNRREPFYSNGRGLLKLWEAHTGNDRDSPPTV